MAYNLTAREKEILRLLSEDSGTSVSEISSLLEVSAVTTRNDLNSLAEKGFIVRTHGGAFPAFHPGVLERQKSMTKEKLKIAQAAADLVNDGDQIMISSGTTTSLIPKFLLGKRDIHIVTSSTLSLPYLRINPALRVTFVGGEFRASSETMAGPIALRELEQFYVKLAFIGSDGFSTKNGVTANSAELAETVRKMSERTEKVVLVTDSTKFNNTGFAHMLPLSEIDTIVTDSNIEENIAELEDHNIQVLAV